jgi:putative ABC transport system ATP-binding protein
MIRLKDVTKEYSGIVALKDVNLHISAGEVVVLKGVSGSGKSTILSLIAGLSKPSSGSVLVDTKEISKMPDHFCARFRRKNIGIIFQRYNLIPQMSVAENILLPLYPQNLDASFLQERLEKLLEVFHIADKKDILVKNLSGGQQQRVAIARAKINSPKIILADEPTANLDKKLSLEFIEILRNLKSQQRTIIVATHDPLFFDLDFVDRYITVEHGSIVDDNS